MNLPDVTEFTCGIEPKWYIQVLSFALVLYWERWLGRTKRFTAASTWDLIVNAAKTIWSKLTPNKGIKHGPSRDSRSDRNI